MQFKNIFSVQLASVLLVFSNVATSESVDEMIHKSLVESAAKLNTNLPMTVDDETRLERVSVHGKTWYARYTMINYAREELSSTQLKNIHDGFKMLHVNSYCTNPGLKLLRDNNSGRELEIYGRNAKWITTITVGPNDCK